MGTRESALKAQKPCPRGCGRICPKRAEQCYACRMGYARVDEIRACTDCGKYLFRVLTARRCRSCIRREQHRNGVFDHPNRGDRWTPDEEARIRALAGKLTSTQIGKEIFRSHHAVRVRANALGVSLLAEDWSLSAIAQLFGCDARTICRDWLETGLLPYRKLDLNQGARGIHAEYRIREADIEAFIQTAPWAYDPSKMFPQWHRLTKLAARMHRRDPWVCIEEASRILGISGAGVRRWCHAGVIPFKRRQVGMGGHSGGHIVIRERDLAAATEEIARRRESARVLIQSNLLETMRRRREEAAA